MVFLPSAVRPLARAIRSVVEGAPPPPPPDPEDPPPDPTTPLTGTPMTDQDRPLKILGTHSFYGGPARAAGVTGGIGRPYYYVTVPGFGTGAGTIRAALALAASDGGRYIRYTIDDPTLDPTVPIEIPNDTTVDARGYVVAWTATTGSFVVIDPDDDCDNWELHGVVVKDGNPSGSGRDVIRVYGNGSSGVDFGGSKGFLSCMKIWIQNASDSGMDITRMRAEGADITRSFVGLDYLTSGDARRGGIMGDGGSASPSSTAGLNDHAIRVMDSHCYLRARQRLYFNHGRHDSHNNVRRFGMHGEMSRNDSEFYSRYDVYDATDAPSTRKSQGHIEYADAGLYGGTPAWSIANAYEKGGSNLAGGDGLTRGSVDAPSYDDWDPCEEDEDDFVWDTNQDHFWTVTISGDLDLITFTTRPARPFAAGTSWFLAGLSHPLTGVVTRVSSTVMTLAPTNAANLLFDGDQLWWKGEDASGNPIGTWNMMFITGDGDPVEEGFAPSVTQSVGGEASATSVTVPVVISGPENHLLVWANARNPGGTAVTATVTCNGISMTLLDSQAFGTPGNELSLWSVANPTSGNIVATGANTPTYMQIVGVALRDAGPIGIPEVATDDAALSISDTVASAVDRLVLAGVLGNNTNFVAGTGMTLVKQQPAAGSAANDTIAVSRIAGAASVTAAHTSTATRDLTQIAVEVRKVGEAAPDPGSGSGDPAELLGHGYATGETLATVGASRNFTVPITVPGTATPIVPEEDAVMVAYVTGRAGNSTLSWTAAGWTHRPELTLATSGVRLQTVYTKIADASELSSNIDFTLATNAGAASWVVGGVYIQVWRGDPVNPLNVSAFGTAFSASAADMVAPGVTTDVANEVLVQVTTCEASNRTVSQDGQMTERVDFNATGLSQGQTLSVATQVIAAPGATGSRTSVLSASTAGDTIMFTLNPQP